MGTKARSRVKTTGGYAIEDIEGIGPAYAAKLAGADIRTTDDLLRLCCDRKGRAETSTTTSVSETLLLKWANMADLMRINGVGTEFSELLEVAGVDTVKELRHRNAENLAAAMESANEKRHLTRALPSPIVISGWIEQAKAIEPLITH